MSVITVAAILNRWRGILALDRTQPILPLRQGIPAQQNLQHRNALPGAGRRFLGTRSYRLTPGMPGAGSCQKGDERDMDDAYGNVDGQRQAP